MLPKPTERGRGKPTVDDDERSEVGASGDLVPGPGVGRGRGRVRPQPQEATVGRGRGRVYSVEGCGDRAVGKGRGQQLQVAATTESPSFYAPPISASSPQEPGELYPFPLSGTSTPLPSTASVSRASTPRKSGSVSPVSTPARSTGLSWGSTPEKTSPHPSFLRPEPGDLNAGISRLLVKEHQLLPPQKRLSVDDAPPHFPGTEGKNILVKANHFPVRVKVPNGRIFMYEVGIQPPWDRPYRKSDKTLWHQVILEWKKACPQVKNNPHCWVFDGMASLYSTVGCVDGEIEDVWVSIPGENRELKFMVRDVNVVKIIPVNKDILEFVHKGRSGSIPQDSIQALNVILQQAAITDLNFVTINQSYFPRDGHVLDIGFGREVWAGIFSTVRQIGLGSRDGGWKDDSFLLSLNVDVSNKSAVKPLHLTEESNPGTGDSYIQQILKTKRGQSVNLSKGLNSDQLEIFRKDIQGLKVKYELPNGNKRHYKVNDIKDAPNKLIIRDLNVTVEEYFLHTYKDHVTQLKYPNLPCLWLGSINKSIFIPVEFCRLESQPQPRAKKLQDDAVSNMIRLTAVKPLERQKKIMEGLKKNNDAFKNDPYAREFGINIAGEMATLKGRILTPPSIQYKSARIVQIRPNQPGSWRPSGNRDLYVDGQSLEVYAVLDLAPIRPGQGAPLSEMQFGQMVKGFHKIATEVGMKITEDKDKILWKVSNEMKAAEDFVKIIEEHEKSGKRLQMILVLLPFKGGEVYDTIKHLGDILHKVVTQCCVKATMFKGKDMELNLQVISNLCLKMNAKLGGKNFVLDRRCRPHLLDRPIMIMGADVSHPAPEHRGIKPSIAAIVGSQDPNATRYEVQVRVQSGEQNEEIIQDMRKVTVNLLRKFFESSKGRKPEKLIMFRDGVSEGQFLKVLASELSAIKGACREMEVGYEPAITYLVVQKRHHTRFFPADNDKTNLYRNGNVLAGTVVDQGINHPTEGDFYLLSHEGIQGTSRPTHYQVLWDDSDLSADELERLAYFLCHLYARCTRSVSYPTPTYYSHLVADRARKHHNEMVYKDELLSDMYKRREGFGKKKSVSNEADQKKKEEELEKKAREAAIKKEIEEAESIPMYFV